MRFFRFVPAVLLCLSSTGAFAQQSLSIEMLKQAVQNAVKDKTPDREIAQFVSTVKLRQKLEPSVVEDLQGGGAGPRTVAALKKLMETSASLAAPPKPGTQPPAPTYADTHPPPSYDDQFKIINEARELALNYTASLPNFICLQVTQRDYDRHFNAGSEASWAHSDTLKARVSYFNQKEEYKLLGVNDEAILNKDYNQVGGAISTGEFGSLLKGIFEPEAHTEFHWLRWGALNGNICHVYKYKVDQEHSHWTVDYQHTDQVTPAYEGLVYIDKKSGVTLRITLEAIMPPTFPIQDVHTQLDYRYTDVSGQSFLLPTVSETRMRHDHTASRNQIEFKGYRRYSADTSISFADVDTDTVATPDKEEKVAPAKPAKPQ